MNNDSIIIEGSCEPAEVLDLSRDLYCAKCGGFISRASTMSIADLLSIPAKEHICPACNSKNIGGDNLR